MNTFLILNISRIDFNEYHKHQKLIFFYNQFFNKKTYTLKF